MPPIAARARASVYKGRHTKRAAAAGFDRCVQAAVARARPRYIPPPPVATLLGTCTVLIYENTSDSKQLSP